jgi:hypothetical protein
MLTDPQTLTVNSIAKSMARINQDNNSAVYRLRSSTDELVLSIKREGTPMLNLAMLTV